MTFVTKRIEPTPSGLHVRYFVPNDPPDVNRYGDIEWKNVVAIIGNRLQYEEGGPAFRALDIFQDDGASEDFIDAPYVDGWLDMVDAIRSKLDIKTRDWFERLTTFEPHPLWNRDHQHYKHLLIYQRDDELPDILIAECEFCGSSYDLIV